MKLYPTDSTLGLLRPLCIATLAITLSACGGSDTADDGVSNPDMIDVNGDGELTAEDDWDFSGTVDQADVAAFAADNGMQTGNGGTTDGGTPDGNIAPMCGEPDVDCVSGNDEWSDNATIAQNRNPISTYALGIQRILYCLNYGGTESGTAIATYADGIYGMNTANSVRTFQEDEMLAIDGVVGGQTWEALQSKLQGPISFDVDYNYWIIPSSRDDCDAQIMFYQRKAAPMDWQQAEVPGSTVKIPFSVNAN